MIKQNKKRSNTEGDLLADERCSPVLDFLRSTYVGRGAPPVEENWDSDEEEEQQAVAAAGVVGEEEVVTRVPLAFCFLCSFPFVFFHCLASLSFVISLVRLFPLLHYFGERVAAELRGGTADRKRSAAIV